MLPQSGNAKALLGIPLAITGWLRYLLAVDDEGNEFELSPDPMNEELQELLSDVRLGQPETYHGQLQGLLKNANIFGSDLYEAGIGSLIEDLFKEEIAGVHAVRNTLKKYIAVILAEQEHQLPGQMKLF